MNQVKISLTKNQQKELKELLEINDNAKRLGMIFAQVHSDFFYATFLENEIAEKIINLSRPDRPYAKPCPFCGEIPSVFQMVSQRPLVLCSNKDCFMYQVVPIHVDDWNSRKVKA